MAENSIDEVQKAAYLEFYKAVQEKLSLLHEFNSDGINHFKEGDVLEVLNQVRDELSAK